MASKIATSATKLGKQKLIPATIVDVVGYRCSIALAGNGKIVRGIAYFGPMPKVGQLVQVDYASGKPIVQTSSFTVQTQTKITNITNRSIQSGASNGLTPPSAINHNDLMGLQGGGLGASGPDFYHLSQAQYDNLGTGVGKGWKNVLFYGAVGNGSHDDTSAFAAAYAAILAEGAGVLYIPYGTYNISSDLMFTVPVMVVGDGIGISIVSCSDNTATIFTFQGSNSGIRDISLTYSSIGTGTAILLNNSQEVFNFQRIYITNCGYGIHITDYVLVNGTQFEIVNYTNGGVWIDNGGRVVTISDFHMYAGSDILGANGGIYLSGTQDSFSAFDGQILTGVRGIYGVESLAIANFYNVYCDTTAQEPLYILNWVDVFFTNCWFSGGRTGSGYDGVFIGGGANTIKFVACKFQNNGKNGIFVASSCANVTISDSTSNNNMYTTSLGAGIWIEAGASKFSISHNTINNEIGIGWGTQSYGVVIDTGCDHYIYDGNLIGGNTYGNINNSSGAANAYIAGNLS